MGRGLVRRGALLGAAVCALAFAGGVLPAPARASGGPTTSSVDVSANPASAGQPVTMKVTVHGTLLSPLGLVQLFDNGALLGPPLTLFPDFDDASPVCSSCVPTDHSSASLTRSFSRGTHALTVVYLGGTDFGSVGGPTVLTVNAAESATSVHSSADPSVHGQDVTFTAHVSSTGETPTGTVQFQVDGADTGTAQPLDGSGFASLDVSSLSVGSHPVSAVFTSDNPDVLGSSGSLTLGTVLLPQIVKAADTTTALGSSADPAEFGTPVTFTATVSVDPPGGGTPAGTVQFDADGSTLGPPVPVDASGQASLTTAALPVGTHSVTAVFSSDTTDDNGSSDELDQTVGPARTTIVYGGDTTADFHDSASLSAVLTRSDDGTPLAGEAVQFTMGSETCSATTDAAGTAQCAVVPGEGAGTYTVDASFAGDTDYQASDSSAPFVVTHEETTTTYTGPAAVLQGQPVTLTAQLLEDGTVPIAGRALTFTLGSGATAVSCTAPATDASGDAGCSVDATLPQGPQPLVVTFAGDAFYLPSADAGSSPVVFAFPARGAFVLGDRTAAGAGAGAVTFWGSHWSSANLLSGGPAPASFKGFAASTPATPACGEPWRTGPGNSSSPDGSLPAYTGTLVASSIGKSGSTISGDVVSIVVVETAPGFAADPGSAGTGTIVATYC